MGFVRLVGFFVWIFVLLSYSERLKAEWDRRYRVSTTTAKSSKRVIFDELASMDSADSRQGMLVDKRLWILNGHYNQSSSSLEDSLFPPGSGEDGEPTIFEELLGDEDLKSTNGV